uniref:CBS domain-containing protein n=1 Tax=Proboscia inermis TaxID=420281 RepID=A0A7S0GM12_9STRA|mmetsp:Transcript_992/g.1032  ORF Transcript_992/g.1032 Transcript_992/m.1032 type:complete len:550 (+) Transcript_992:145-1794(+)
MKIAAALCPLVRVVIFVLFPIAAPIAKMLDVFLGHSDASIVEFKRGELKSLVQFMYREQNNKHGMDKEEGDFEHTHDNSANGFHKSTSYIEGDEINVIEGALSMTTLTAENIFQPLAEVFAIEKDDELDEQKISEIYKSGFSRIPVYEKNRENICGIILTRKLIPKMLEDEKITMSSIQKSPLCVDSNMNLIDLLNLFQMGRSKDIAHMAIVCKDVNKAKYAISSGNPIPKSGGVIGVITLEDVIERLIKKEILDETDAENSPIVMSLTRGVSFGRKSTVRVNSLRRSGSMHSSVISTNGREKYQKEENETTPLSNDSSIFVDNESDREIRSERNLTLLHEDEAKVLEGALSLKTKFAADILTNLGRIYAVNSSDILNKQKILEICSSGFSRVPVYTGSVANICGYFLTKRLILIKDEDQMPVSSVIQQKPILVRSDLNLVDLLSKFIEEKNHMAVVCNNVKLAESAFREDSSIPLGAGVLGVVTLEDVIEEIIQEEIYDEKDVTKIEEDKEFIKYLSSKSFTDRSTRDRLFSVEITSDILDESSPLLC